jgi:hypothetical protein
VAALAGAFAAGVCASIVGPPGAISASVMLEARIRLFIDLSFKTSTQSGVSSSSLATSGEL